MIGKVTGIRRIFDVMLVTLCKFCGGDDVLRAPPVDEAPFEEAPAEEEASE